jgi:hypothetical protein
MSRFLLPLLALSLLLAGPAPSRDSAEDERKAGETLKTLNSTARAFYGKAQQAMLARGGPIVVVEGEELVLVHGGKREVATILPEVYNDLKAVGHVALGLHALFLVHGEAPLEEADLSGLSQYRARIEAGEKALPHRKLDKEQRERLAKCLATSRTLVDAILRARRCKAREMKDYFRTMTPLIESSAAEAARVQLDGLERQMTAWKAKMTGKEWGELTVVVMGSQMPRKNNVAVQYFSRLLGEPGEGKRIVYAEALYDETRALNLLGTHRVDTRVGVDFFGDPQRMFRDLLGDAARVQLDERFGKRK